MSSFVDTDSVGPGATKICDSVTVYRFDEPLPPAHYRSTEVCACVVWQGVGCAAVEGRQYTCPEGSYIVKAWLPDGFETEIVQATETSPFLASLLEFNGDEVSAALGEMRRAVPVEHAQRKAWAPYAYVSEASPELRGLVASLATLASSASWLENTLLFRLRRREVLYKLLFPMFCPSALTDDSKTVAHSADLQAAIELLSQDLSSPLRVADLARAVNMSPSRFAHVFKESMGVSPHRFRKQLRLEQARFLLDEKQWSVSAVASEVGYSNVSHFIGEFKRIFGQTPGSITGKP